MCCTSASKTVFNNRGCERSESGGNLRKLYNASYGLPYSVDAFSKFQMREQFQNLLLMLETSQGSSFEITLKNIENSNYIDSLYATIAPTMN